MHSILNIFDKKNDLSLKTEILSGLTVALALIPEAVAFALIAGLSPLTGLYAAFVMGIVTAILGGKPGMISGATGAVAIVIVSLAASHGPEYIFATVVLAGLIQLLSGVLRFGKFIRLVPHPVIFGFVNGLAIIIFMSQLVQFQDDSGAWLTGSAFGMMLGLVLLSIAIIWQLPRLTKLVPSSLAAILIVFAVVAFFGIDTKTVGDIASIQGGFPPFHIPSVPFTFETLMIILPYAGIMAAVGMIESLLTLGIVEEITGDRGRGNKEVVAQGTANICSGFFSGMGGCAMLGQSLINVSSGARTRLSGIVASLMLLIFIMFGSGLVERLPMAALVGVMVMVAVGTFEWASLKSFGKMPRPDVFVMLTVTIITAIVHNLALAVIIGVIIAALVFAWDNATRIRVRGHIAEDGIKYYIVHGPLFFGSTAAFMEKFHIQDDPSEVIIDFIESRVVDMSAIEALNKITKLYKENGKIIHLRHLSPDCLDLLENAGDIIDVNVLEDPTYRLAIDSLQRKKKLDKKSRNI